MNRRSFIAALSSFIASATLPMRGRAIEQSTTCVEDGSIRSIFALRNWSNGRALILAPCGEGDPTLFFIFNGRGDSASLVRGGDLPTGFIDDALNELLANIEDDLRLLGLGGLRDQSVAHVVSRQGIALLGPEPIDSGVTLSDNLLSQEVRCEPGEEHILLQNPEFHGGESLHG